jgi:hypothetical protein
MDEYYPAPAIHHQGKATHEWQSAYGKYGEYSTEVFTISEGAENVDLVAFERQEPFQGDYRGFSVNGFVWERGDYLIVPNGDWENPRWIILRRVNSSTEYESLSDAMEAVIGANADPGHEAR